MTRFRRNPRLEQQLQRQPQLRRALTEFAEDAQRHAEGFMQAAGGPWMPRKGSRSSTKVVTEGDEVRLVNLDHAGHLQEWGSRNNPPHAPLRRGVRAAGLRLDEQ